MIEITYKYTLKGVHYSDSVKCKYTRKIKVINELKREFDDIKIIRIRRVGEING
jgi:hypothetical protein